MPQAKKIVIIAGEESGDKHAAAVVKQLLARHPLLEVSGIGGRHMQAAGVALISDLAIHGVTGLTEVLAHGYTIYKAYKAIQAHLKQHQPDLLILVDYPGFNLRLARYAKRVLGLQILYYISPQIWAWKPKRITTIKEVVDHMAVILPFEKKVYEEAGIPVSFVGHPLMDTINAAPDQQTARQALGLPLNKQLLAMLPGSRDNEIKRHMPVLRDTACLLHKQNPSLHLVIPIAGTIDKAVIQGYFTKTNIPITLIEGHAIEVVASSDCVVVASGTASLECALLEKPMCIIYKASLLTYIAATKLIQVKFLGLCNLLQNEMIAPELLQYDCNPIELTRTLSELLTNQTVKNRMKTKLQALSRSLSSQQADCSLAHLIEQKIF